MFTDKAIEAVLGNDKFQTYVRDYIKSELSDKTQMTVAEELAAEVAEFRRAIDAWVQDAATKAEFVDRRKKVNNIINDTSRICRELLGFSIKCTSRKNHAYDCVPAPEKVKKEPKSEHSEIAPPEVDKDAIIMEAIKETPNELIRALVIVHGAEAIGTKVAALLREMT